MRIGVGDPVLARDDAPCPARAAVASMTALNARAADVLALFAPDVHACTDVTGFGLIGHATEMAVASGVTLDIGSGDLPLLEGVRDSASTNRSGGMESNREHFAPGTSVDAGIDAALVDVAYDPQTSGGLLAAVAVRAADAIRDALSAAGAGAAIVGRVRRRRLPGQTPGAPAADPLKTAHSSAAAGGPPPARGINCRLSAPLPGRPCGGRA